LLDRESPDYPFDVLTLCESIVEDPDQILRRQVDKLKTAKLAELKAADVPYEERMAKLDEIEHPKPRREFIYDTFNAWAAKHPWVGRENIRPKSIAREMFERYLSFADYVREYGLERSEGLLLRHLSQTWKVLSQTVPETAKTEPVLEMEDYFRELIRAIDSSLLEEWEQLRATPGDDAHGASATDPAGTASPADKPARPSTFDITRDQAAFRRVARTAVLGFLQDVAARDWESAADRLAAAGEDEPQRIEHAFHGYFEEHPRFRLDPEGRSTKHTHWLEEGAPAGEWELAQVLVDADEQNDWEARFTIPLAESRAQGRAVLAFAGVRRIGS
ncbi:MAG TPA: DUF3516 domain-containing protein, partial [Opitutus sp.]|nr:DUF3516 domain-containing protein [Opitutus sp.]